MKRTVFFLVIAALVLAACGTIRKAVVSAPAPAVQPSSGIAPQMGGGAPVQESYAQQMPASAYDQSSTSGTVAAAPADRIVIQNADLTIVVTDVEKRAREIEQMAKDMGGYLVSAQHYQSYTNNNVAVPEATLTIRIPAEKLDEALGLIKKDTVDVQNENRTGEDVTNQYVDLQSQLKAKQAAEQQLLKIMKDATKTEDVLAVYQQLQTIQSDIEVLKGQIKYYDEAARLSAITVRVIAEETVQPIKIPGWKPGSVAAQAFQDLKLFLQNFASFMIGFFVRDLWEILLIALPFVILFLIGRAIFRKMRANRSKKEIVAPPAVEQ